jgi:hypothetical protein
MSPAPAHRHVRFGVGHFDVAGPDPAGKLLTLIEESAH